MINLLPIEDKKQIRAARTNTLLIRYNFILITAIVFLGLASGVAYFYLETARQEAESIIAENKRKEGEYESVKASAASFQSQLGAAKTILGEDTSYAKAVLSISRLLPQGTALSELKLDQTSFATPLILSVNIKDEAAAKSLLENFESSSMFSKVTKGTISINESSAYPYTMELTVSMSKEAAQ